MEHPPCSLDLAPNDFWLFLKMKFAIKRRRFQEIEDIWKMWRQSWKLFHNRSSKNCFQLYQHRSIWKVIPPSKL